MVEYSPQILASEQKDTATTAFYVRDLVTIPVSISWMIFKTYTSREGHLVNGPLPCSWTV